MGEEDNPTAKFNPGKKFCEWSIVKKLDEGGFGQVYQVESVKDKKTAALKAEPNDVDGGSAIKLELAVLQMLTDDVKPHIPIVYHAAKHKKYCYMIMTLLGENLKALKISCPKELMSVSTWTRIGIQCLYGIKVIHDIGYVHRDIKPNNFVLGHKTDPDRSRIVHILDFGLARSYASLKKDKWVARRARGTAEFRGTLRYVSLNVHDKREQGRVDDIWSLFYVLIELHCGLPWQTLRDKAKIETKKMSTPDSILCLNMPKEMHTIMPHLRTLNCYERPDYSLFYDALVAVMKRTNVKYTDPYDWEKADDVEKVIKEQKSVPPWEDATEFFKSDPVNISGPPVKDSEKSLAKK